MSCKLVCVYIFVKVFRFLVRGDSDFRSSDMKRHKFFKMKCDERKNKNTYVIKLCSFVSYHPTYYLDFENMNVSD